VNVVGARLAGAAGCLVAVLVVALAAPAPSLTLATALPLRDLACPLTAPQEMQAVLAFADMMPVFRHPRCTNCHGGVNPFVPFPQGGHRGGAVNPQQQPQACEDCHGLLPGWRIPGQALHFTTKTDRQLCEFFKQLMPQGPGIFIDHITFEPGLPKFIEQAFKGDKALNTLGEITLMDDFQMLPRIERPPGTHADLIAAATAWGTAIGRGWRASPECGCTVRGAWHGTVTASGEFQNAGMAGTMRVTSSASVVLEPDPRPGAGPGVLNYRATGGRVRWDALVTGACHGNAGGSMPLDTLDVDGHPMAELRLEDLGNGRVKYEPTTGSWPDRWAPIFDLQCNISGAPLTLPTTNLLPTWWHYDIPAPPTTTDPNRLKGTYRWSPSPGIVVIWEWDLSRMP
jgi:hypothetical protein